MEKFVKNIFLTMMGVVVAMLLYFAFFGFHLSGDSYYSGNEWEGALWYAGRAIETPLSRFYYEYCYLPTVNRDNAVDSALGGTQINPLQKTESDLTDSSTRKSSDNYSFESATSSSNISYYYSTGWY